jgi:hypothetical protein
MAISRSLMNRQLQANGGIMQVTPRENFGIGSSIKKFVRKVIPNEVADIAVKAAPFVAPFNPALAGAMAGIGSFDQTGSLSGALKSGALTYGGGQLARYAGGAGFQGNPFASGGAFTPAGFTSGFSSPLGSKTGLGKFFSNRGADAVQGVGDNTIIPKQKPTNLLSEQMSEVSLSPNNLAEQMSEVSLSPRGSVVNTVIDKSVVAEEPGFLKNLFDGVSNQDYGKVAQTIGDGAKKFGKAMFTKPDGEGGTMIDKAAVMGAVAFAGSYAEAQALAADAGVEITPEEYDEATKAEKKEEYAGYLTNFFGGKKDGGRIGFDEGANKKISMIKDMLSRNADESLIMSITNATQEEIDSIKNSKVEEKAQGGRIGLKFGSEPEDAEVGIMTIDVEAGDDEEENDLMAGITFSSAEKSYLFRRLGGAGGSDRSYTMPNLYRILNNPDRYAEDAAVLKEIAIMGLGKKDGGRIGYKGGANRVSELLILRDELVGKGEDVSDIEAEIFQLTGKTFKSVGGISDVPTGEIRKNNAGVTERDYRDEGGFVPVGIKERADDVPAMLSKNEFVMTADAVRGIGNGSVEEGSKKLYNTMKQAEKVGKA